MTPKWGFMSNMVVVNYCMDKMSTLRLIFFSFFFLLAKSNSWLMIIPFSVWHSICPTVYIFRTLQFTMFGTHKMALSPWGPNLVQNSLDDIFSPHWLDILVNLHRISRGCRLSCIHFEPLSTNLAINSHGNSMDMNIAYVRFCLILGYP